MAGGRSARSSGALESWERELVKAAAASIRTTEREDLEAVLAVHLWQIKRRIGGTARNWKALAATAARNKAANWIRDRQLLERRSTSLDALRDESGDPRPALSQILAASGSDADSQLALRCVWDEIDKDLRRAWTLLVEENGNQAMVARRLGKHRNTVRLWIGRIQEALERHGFGAGR